MIALTNTKNPPPERTWIIVMLSRTQVQPRSPLTWSDRLGVERMIVIAIFGTYSHHYRKPWIGGGRRGDSDSLQLGLACISSRQRDEHVDFVARSLLRFEAHSIRVDLISRRLLRFEAHSILFISRAMAVVRYHNQPGTRVCALHIISFALAWVRQKTKD